MLILDGIQQYGSASTAPFEEPWAIKPPGPSEVIVMKLIAIACRMPHGDRENQCTRKGKRREWTRTQKSMNTGSVRS